MPCLADLPNPEIKPASPVLQADSLPLSHLTLMYAKRPFILPYMLSLSYNYLHVIKNKISQQIKLVFTCKDDVIGSYKFHPTYFQVGVYARK